MRRPLVRIVAVVAWLAVLGTVLWITPVDGDDAYHHSVISVEQVKCWRHGVLWPRFHPDWNGGTGSFLPSIYAPLTLTAEGLACLVTGEGSRAASLVLLAGLFGGAMLLWTALRLRGLEGGLAWLVAAYPLAAVLARATTTEVMALAFVAPVLVLGLPPGPRSRGEGAALAVAVALVAGCQVGMVLMVALLLAGSWLVSWNSWRWRDLGAAAWFGGGVLAGGIFWWPTVHDIDWMARKMLVHGEYDWRTHHVFSMAANAELGPFLLACFVSLLVVVLIITWRARGQEELRPVAVAVAWALVLATPLSFPLWRAVPFMAGLQFPWRFLGLATILCLIGVVRLERGLHTGVLLLLAAPAVLIPFQLAAPTPALTPDLGARELARRSSARYAIATVLPSMPGFFAPGFNGITSLQELHRQKVGIEILGDPVSFPRVFRIQAAPGSEVLLPLQWWPELNVGSHGGDLAFTNRLGLVAVRVGGGEERIVVSLAPSGARRAGALFSVAGLLLCAGLWAARVG